MLQIFRALLPSWKFFDRPGAAPELYLRYSIDSDTFGEWMLCIPKIKQRSLKNLWVNSHENFLFASHALLEYLKNDLEEKSNPETSLVLVTHLVRFRLKEIQAEATQFQFMVNYAPTENGALYLSEVLS